MKAWVELGSIPHPLLRALRDLEFYQPTEIQKRTIPLVAMGDNDIIGAAETGSGKTLAFGIPILQYIINNCYVHHSTVVAESIEHAQKYTAAKNKKINRGKPTNTSGREQEIIDLNEVLHKLEGSSTRASDGESGDDASSKPSCDTSLKVTDASDDSEGGQPLPPDGDMETDENLSLTSTEDEIDSGSLNLGNISESKSVWLREEEEDGRGLIGFQDNIPDEVFEKMISGELDPWVMHDVTAMSHDTPDKSQVNDDKQDDETGNGGIQSHDIKAQLLGVKDQRQVSGSKLVALILAPTRELAIQVHDHLVAAAKYTKIKVCAMVGGMAMEKQERLLSRRPSIVVATPGRLWKLMSEGNPHLNDLESLKFLVLDEADRMIEFGHFRELRSILDRVNGTQAIPSSRQTMVFSATLTVGRRSTERKRRKKTTSGQESIENLMQHVNLREDAHMVDLTRSKVTVETLMETKITCTVEEKDIYLYYFLLLYPGRTLVFVNSIDCLQRLRALLELLHMKPLPLHAHMQQRQRLKNLDRFTSNESSVLVASDVAARGLDLPQVHHVIHYQLPRNTELYVHRSGRTARAQREGLSVMLVGPEDLKSYRNICKSLNKDEELPTFPVDSTYLKAVRQRVSLARQIHKFEYRRNRIVRAEQWLSKSAKALDIELDEDLLEKQCGKSSKRDKRAQESKKESKILHLRATLQQLLATPIIPRTISMTFPTRDHAHQTILTKLHASKESDMNQVVLVEKRDALTVARTRAVV